MSNKPKSTAQKLFTRLVSPAGAARMEAESRTWIAQCPKCGFERSVWDVGGVRYKAAGTSWWFMRCPHCGRSAWNKVFWPTGVEKSDVYATAKAGPRPGAPVTGTLSEQPPWLLWIVVGIIWLGLIGVAVFVGGFLVMTLIVNPLTQPVANAGDAFMTAVKTSNYAQATQLCTPDFEQQVGGVDGLEKMFQGNQPAQWNWTRRSITNGTGYLNGSLTFADGRKGTAQLTLREIGNEWKIANFRMNPP